MDEVDEATQIVGIGRRENAVAKIEDMAGAAGGLVQDPAGLIRGRLEWAEEQGRIEVALDGTVGHERPTVGEPDPPVEPDDVAAGIGHRPQQAC